MNALTREQKNKVNDFVSFTSASQPVAIRQLKQFSWNLERAVDEFFTNPPADNFAETAAKPKGVDKSKVEQFFRKYADPATLNQSQEDPIISEDGMSKLFTALGVDAENDIVTLVLAWQLDAHALGEFTQKEFVDGMTKL